MLDTNAWLGGAELDVVARRGSVLVFCEVKSKSGDGYGDPAEMVSPLKAHRLRRAAELWIAAHPEHADSTVCFDVVVVRGHRLERLPNAL